LFNKSFSEMMKIDVRPYCDMREAKQDEQATFDEKRYLAAQKQKWQHGNKRKLY